MKSSNFSGQGASQRVHLASLTWVAQRHRQSLPGQKIPGRLDEECIIVQHLEVIRITILDLVLSSAVPGVDDAFVLVE